MPAERQQIATPEGEGDVTVTQATLDAGDIGTGPSTLQLALVVALVWVLATGAVALLYQIDPGGPWRLMPILALTVAVESVLTRRWLERAGRKRRHSMYALAELVVLLTLAPLFLWLASGQVPFPGSLVELLESPFKAFSLPLVLYMCLAVFVWHRTHRWAELFIRLSITSAEVKYYSSTPSERSSDWSIVVPLKYRSQLLNAFIQSWIVGGVFLIVITALVSVDLGDLSQTLSAGQNLRTVTRLGLSEDILLGLLVYFLGGLWLISQGRAVVLKGRWLADGSRRDPNVVAKWRQWALLLIVFFSLLALFLPIGTTFPLLQVLKALARLASNIAFAIFALLSWLLFMIASLFPGGESLPEQGPRLDPAELLQQNPAPADTTFNVPTSLAGSAFWLALIGLTIVATVYFMSERGPDITLAQLKFLWRRFRRWMLTLGRGAAVRMTSLNRPIRWPFRRLSLDTVGRQPFRFLRVGGLPPREQVRSLYLSLVRYAASQGLPRAPEETPIEFAHNLKAQWPEASVHLDQLTDAFLAARYAEGEIDESRLQSAKNAWLRIRRLDHRKAE